MTRITQAFVLGAGLGTRLRPLTDELPKPLVPVFGKPLITFAFDHLLSSGVREFVVNTHRLSEQFRAEFSNARYHGAAINFIHEPVLLGTGGGIRNALPALAPEPFIVYSGDVLTDFELEPLVAEHFRARNAVTLALRKTEFEPSIRLRDRRITEIVSGIRDDDAYDFANVSIWQAELARELPREPSSFIPSVRSAIERGEKIGGLAVADGQWFNIGSPAQYLEVHRRIDNSNWRPRFAVEQGEWPVRVAPDSKIATSAELRGFYSISNGCVVGEGARIEDTILWPGAQIASRSYLCRCIVRSRRSAAGKLCDETV